MRIRDRRVAAGERQSSMAAGETGRNRLKVGYDYGYRLVTNFRRASPRTLSRTVMIRQSDHFFDRGEKPTFGGTA